MKSKALKNVLNVNGVGIIGMYLVVFIGLSIACPNFLKFSNIMIGIRQAVYTAIVAFAMTFVISLGGIDLSVGSTVGISGMVLAAMILGGYNIYLAIGVVILLGAFIGLVNGLLVTKPMNEHTEGSDLCVYKRNTALRSQVSGNPVCGSGIYRGHSVSNYSHPDYPIGVLLSFL